MNEATAKAGSEAKELVVETAFDGQEIARLDTIGSSGVEALLATAHGLHSDRDKWIPQPERIEILHRAASIMKSRADKLATDAALEGGKPLIDSQVEVARAIDGVENCIEVLRTEQGHVIPMNVNGASAGRVAQYGGSPGRASGSLRLPCTHQAREFDSNVGYRVSGNPGRSRVAAWLGSTRAD